jgi:hypothetical protein
MSWLGPASKKREKEKGKITQMNGPQTRCEIEPEDRPPWGEERCTEQLKPWTKGRYKSAIGYSVMRRIYNPRQGDPVSIPSALAEDNPRLGSCLWIIISVI